MIRTTLFLTTILTAVPAAAQQRVEPTEGATRAGTDVSPYINVGQVLTADLTNGNDVLTYTTVQAGVNASVQTRRVQAQINYNYEHRIGWGGNLDDTSIHSGLAVASAQLAPGLGFDVTGIATRARSDIRGVAPGVLAGNVSNVSQLYGIYGGPTLQQRIDAMTLNAAYRIGYTKVETPDSGIGLIAGQPRLDFYDDSVSHMATASIGARPDVYAPFGFTLSGLYEREDASQLDQRYEGYYGRLDLLQPISGTVALTAGVGYEAIQIGQRDPLVNANGTPILDENGRFQTDPNSPRRLAYDIDGIFYDAGVIWRPSPRMTLEARIGERYGTFSGTGRLQWQTGPQSGLQVVVYDSVQSFGRQLGDGLAALPTSFNNPFDGFGGGYNGCVFGTQGGSAGGCLNSVFQSITTANYRARGIDAVYAATVGRSRYGVGAGYANRRFYAPDNAPGVQITGLEDESFYVQAFAARELSADSGVTADVFMNWYRAGLGGIETAGVGATGAYYHNWGRLNGIASLGVYASDQQAADAAVVAQALLGLGYRF